MRIVIILAICVSSPSLFAGEIFEATCPGFENPIAEDMRVSPNEFNKKNVLRILERLENNPEEAQQVDSPVLGAKGAQWAWLIRGYVLRSEFKLAKSKSEATTSEQSESELSEILEARREAFCQFLVDEGSYR